MVKSDIEQTAVNEALLRTDPNMQSLSDEGAQNVSDPSSESVSQYESTLPHDLQENPSDIQNFQVLIIVFPFSFYFWQLSWGSLVVTLMNLLY
jgi:hypothetical protein